MVSSWCEPPYFLVDSVSPLDGEYNHAKIIAVGALGTFWMFIGCSWTVPWMFRCSWTVPWMFRCSWNILEHSSGMFFPGTFYFNLSWENSEGSHLFLFLVG
jgi:hypothetical protein